METLICRIRVAIAQTLQKEPSLDPEMIRKVVDLLRLIDAWESDEEKINKAA